MNTPYLSATRTPKTIKVLPGFSITMMQMATVLQSRQVRVYKVKLKRLRKHLSKNKHLPQLHLQSIPRLFSNGMSVYGLNDS